ncbi:MULTISPECIES: ClbS/DfsB family four-helix bundle protein [unclassified Roseibium]|uniref:ClbS/DfsB family four-helix bundle protein n=1 Tax=unclassified Roseibium TaxID=2629323 RepID=UPI00273F4B2D|nr:MULTISPECIES: ClbS/DfsB family four-helix bundle protein [unclassified Roseibium]
MAAGSKSELLEITEKEWSKLKDVLDAFPAMQRLEKDEDGISPKDIVGHRAHWIELFLKWYQDGQSGVPVHIPAEGYKWSETPRYNADLRARQSGFSWVSVRTLLEANHFELLALVENLTDKELYGAPMKGSRSKWAAGRFAEAAGASHYRSAVKYLRKRMRAAKAG